MPNKAIPQTQKIRDLSKEKDELLNEAAGLYLAEGSKPKKDQRSSRDIAKDLEERHFKETGHRFKLWHQTIIERSRGRRSQVEYASDREILTPEEREVVLGYLTQSANQGFPLTHSRLKDVVDDILRAQLGAGYPGVGQKY
ncbi:hypothetical protein FA15DRAFT_548024, partial [Coprinopsis marcescibilis]